MNDLLGPWFILGGYALSFVLLWIAGRLESRTATGSTVCHALCGITASGTTLYWLSVGTDSGVPLLLWCVVPLVVTAVIMWRGWHQRNWIERLAASTEPSFGIVPARGRAVGLDHPDPGPRRTTVEFEHRGHRLLGIEYSTNPPREGDAFAPLGRVAEEIDSINAVVELRIPAVPALTISPRTKAFEPDFFTPFEDARITRNAFGWLRPDTALDTVDIDPEFDRRFSVSTSDPEFAAALLTGEVRELIMNDLWFRVHDVGFHRDAIWTTDTGGLTEDRMFGNARRLAMLVATVPAPLWEVWAGNIEFHSVAAGSDTGYDAWTDTSGGVRAAVNRRREAADRQPVTSTSLTARSLIASALLAVGIVPVANSAATLIGLAPHVQLTVTDISEGGTRRCINTTGGLSCTTDRSRVGGTYERDGATHATTAAWIGGLPHRGDVVEIMIGPFWGHPGYQNRFDVVFDLVLGLVAPLLGYYLVKRTYLPRPSRRARKIRKYTAERSASTPDNL